MLRFLFCSMVYKEDYRGNLTRTLPLPIDKHFGTNCNLF